MSNTTTAIVIDDDRDIVEIFSEYLQILRIDVVGSGCDGKSAVELYRQKKPDVIFLDLIMPDHNGFFALENIRMADPGAKIAVITADLQKDVIQKLEDLKLTKIIFKPFDMDKIIDVIEEIKKK